MKKWYFPTSSHSKICRNSVVRCIYLLPTPFCRDCCFPFPQFYLFSVIVFFFYYFYYLFVTYVSLLSHSEMNWKFYCRFSLTHFMCVFRLERVQCLFHYLIRISSTGSRCIKSYNTPDGDIKLPRIKMICHLPRTITVKPGFKNRCFSQVSIQSFQGMISIHVSLSKIIRCLRSTINTATSTTMLTVNDYTFSFRYHLVVHCVH